MRALALAALALALAALQPAGAAAGRRRYDVLAAALRDHRVLAAGARVRELASPAAAWRLRCAGPSCDEAVGAAWLPATVPGDLLSDLENAGVIGDPLHEANFREQSHVWARGTWIYAVDTTLEARAADRHLWLVLDGVKMGARVLVNGREVAVVSDQFLRRVVPLENAFGRLRIEIVFDNDIDEKGRFMACSGGWDWAPFTRRNKGEAHVMSKGIWKSVYLVASPQDTMVTHIVPQIVPAETYTSPLCGAARERGDCRADWAFDLEVRAHVQTSATNATVLLYGDWDTRGPLASGPLSGSETDLVAVLRAPARITPNVGVNLWWPNGLGDQHMHTITVCLEYPDAAHLRTCTSRQIGFRSASLVTGDDTDPVYVRAARGAEGNSNHGMYFRVNGHVLLARGANVIPMDNQEARYRGDAHARLVESAAHAHFNMVRVWGGGVFLPRAFYEACDRHGVMVFHDMMYAQRGHAPLRVRTQAEEIRHQVRRLAHHPCIVVWNSCNECVVVPGTPTAIYADFVVKQVIREDISRVVWPSCPSNGWARGVHRLSSLPLSRDANLVPHVNVSHTIEAHGPYRHGTGFPATNGATAMQRFAPDMPTTLGALAESPGSTGPSLPNTFASEFGTVVMSSYESLAPTLDAAHHGLHGGAAPDQCTSDIYENECTGNNSMAERNYPCDSLLEAFFGPRLHLDATGERSFRAQLYLCMLAQALDVKSVIERFRAGATFGMLTWQLNEIWPTGGWGSLEYGSARPGQVLGGRWKLLHHWMADFLYTDAFVACGRDGRCVFRVDDDRFGAAAGTGAPRVTLRVDDIDLGSGASTTRFHRTFTLHAPFVPRAVDILSAPDDNADDGDAAILRVATLLDSTGAVLAQNEALMELPRRTLSRPLAKSWTDVQLEARVLPGETAQGHLRVRLGVPQVQAQAAPAVLLYVHLTTLAQGRFLHNGFAFMPGAGFARCVALTGSACELEVEFRPFAPDQAGLLNKTVRADHLGRAVSILLDSYHGASVGATVAT